MNSLIDRLKDWLGYGKARWRKEAVDQSAHFLIAFVILLPASPEHWLLGALSGAGIGLVREFTETDGANWRSTLDVLFWALGGAAASLI